MGQYSLKMLCVYFRCTAKALITMREEIMRRHCYVHQGSFSSLKLHEWCVFLVRKIMHTVLYHTTSRNNLHPIKICILRKDKKLHQCCCPQLSLIFTVPETKCLYTLSAAFAGKCISVFVSPVILSPLTSAVQNEGRLVSELSELWLESALLQWLREQAFAAKTPSKGTRKATFIQASSHICLH